MAKQNFLAGGYFGKLGATVGQRWKNIRTIRTYVIPHNPRTPKQQANRNTFSQAVPYAQLGQQTNFGSVLFKDEAKTEWSLRMRAALENIKNGLRDVGIVPTYPALFSPTYEITEMDITHVTAGFSFDATITGTLPEGARRYSAILYLSDVAPEFQYLVCAGESTAEHPEKITFYNPNASKIELSPIFAKIVSTDDETVDTVVASGKISVTYSGQLYWSWVGCQTDFELIDDRGIIALQFSKDGLGNGLFTGTAEVERVYGTNLAYYEDGTTESFTGTPGNFSFQESLNFNHENIMRFDWDMNLTNPGNKRVVRAVLTQPTIRLQFTNYVQNGYSNVLTGSLDVEEAGIIDLTL